MRALRSCDFCDSEAAGTFELLPPELEPTEAEQRRLVLCPDCKSRLETVLEPLLARLGIQSERASAEDRRPADTRPPRADDEPTASLPSEEATPGSLVASADESTEKRSRTRSPNAAVSGTSTAPIDETGITLESTDTEAPAETGETAPSQTDADSDDETDGNDEPATDDEAAQSGDDESQTDTGEDTAQTSEDPEDSDSADAIATESSPTPRSYGNVLRLLRNREFPMSRDAVEALAAGAYDLETHEATAVVDHAIERGEFEERAGTLHRA